MPNSATTAPPRKTSTKSAGTSSATKNSSRPSAPAAPATPAAAPSGSALEIKDTRTNKTYTVPIADDAIRAPDLKKIKTADPDDLGLVSYDPAFLNTASCRSAITFIDGDKG